MKSLKVNINLSFLISKELDNWSLRKRHAYNLVKQGDCYRDALEVLTHLNGQGYYCEGWGISSGLNIPVEHAWVWFDGQVIDVSWEDDNLGKSEYYPSLVVSFNRLTSSGGYQAPLMYDRKALKRLGVEALPLMQFHQKKIMQLLGGD